MNINANSMFNDMQSMIAKTQMQTPNVTSIPTDTSDTTKVAATSGSDFSSMLKSAVDNVQALQMNSKELQTAFEMGDKSVSLSEVMIAGQKSSVAFSATVEVRNKFVEAYKEIMSMPV